MTTEMALLMRGRRDVLVVEGNAERASELLKQQSWTSWREEPVEPTKGDEPDATDKGE
jgi:hypothetical protein